MTNKKDKIAKADEWYFKAEEEGDVLKRIEYYTKAIELNPDFFEAYSNRAIDYTTIDNYELSIKDLTKAIEITEGKETIPYINRASTYIGIQNYKEALDDLLHVMEINPQEDTLFEMLGDCYFQLKNYNKALKEYNKAISKNIDINEYTYLKRGETLLKLEKFTEAIQDFNKAIKMNNKLVRAYNYRALSLIKMDDTNAKKALKDFSKALEIEPENGKIYYNRGVTLSNMGKPGLGIKDFLKAIELYKKDPEADKEFLSFIYMNIGTAYLKNDEPKKAIVYFNDWIKSEPTDADAYLSRGWAYYETENFDKAIKDYEKGLEIEANEYDYARLIELYIFTGQYKEALHFINATIPSMDNEELRTQYDYYEFIVKTILKEDTRDCKEELMNFLDADVKLMFPIDFFEEWLDREEIPLSLIDPIVEITERILLNMDESR